MYKVENFPSIHLVGDYENHVIDGLMEYVSSNQEDIQLVTAGKTETVYNWSIDTKYYECVVNLIVNNCKLSDFGSVELTEHCDAFIVMIHALDDLEQLDAWLEKLPEEVGVKLLVSGPVSEQVADASRQWCIENEFEYITLDSSSAVKELDNDGEDDEEGPVGTERIIEALKSNTWSNLRLKPGIEMGEALAMDESRDGFSHVFRSMAAYLGSLSTLTDEQRRLGAEQIVTSFWRSIGGSRDELLDL